MIVQVFPFHACSKGIHLAIKSGMLAAQTAADALLANDTSEKALQQYQTLVDASFIYKNVSFPQFQTGFANGLICGGFHFGTQIITCGAGFSSRLRVHPDYLTTIKVNQYKRKLFKNVSKTNWNLIKY